MLMFGAGRGVKDGNLADLGRLAAQVSDHRFQLADPSRYRTGSRGRHGNSCLGVDDAPWATLVDPVEDVPEQADLTRELPNALSGILITTLSGAVGGCTRRDRPSRVLNKRGKLTLNSVVGDRPTTDGFMKLGRTRTGRACSR